MLTLDHIAVAAENLADARTHVEDSLGQRMRPGGQHAHFGTHNNLLGLEEGLYLEAIAIDPDAPAPDYPRWFDLDRFEGAPRIGNWICRAEDLDHTVKAIPQAGDPVALSRGDVRWSMAVPGDGVLPYDNRFPAIMQWHSRPTPAETLPPSGCRLLRLTVQHPEAEALAAELAAYLDDDRLRFETGAPGFAAEFETPSGRRSLE